VRDVVGDVDETLGDAVVSKKRVKEELLIGLVRWLNGWRLDRTGVREQKPAHAIPALGLSSSNEAIIDLIWIRLSLAAPSPESVCEVSLISRFNPDFAIIIISSVLLSLSDDSPLALPLYPGLNESGRA
jgi:hypothetical protein